MVNVFVAQLPGHKVLQPGRVPRLAHLGGVTANNFADLCAADKAVCKRNAV